MMIPAVDEQQRGYIESMKTLILNEVNVKNLKFIDSEGVLVKKVKCNFRTMGKKFGKLMKTVAAAIDSLDQAGIALLEKQGFIELTLENQPVTIEAQDVEIISEDIPGWLVSNEGNLTVALEVELTDELRNEGMARELINRIQNIRKDSGLEITDHINVVISPDATIEAAVNQFADYIKTQVLADTLNIADNDGSAIDIDELAVKIKVEKV